MRLVLGQEGEYGMQAVEHITYNGNLLAIIIRARMRLEKTTFFTAPELTLQVGSVVYPASGKIASHFHHPIERRIVGTSEVIIVKKGRCLIDFYSDDKKAVGSRELYTGDILILVSGGHGFQMLEDTVLLEVKQGPYIGLDEKERF
jgi:hypothetical protein